MTASRFGSFTCQFGGTPDYASSHSLRGGKVGTADDMESLGYTLLELHAGDLPWAAYGGGDAAFDRI